MSGEPPPLFPAPIGRMFTFMKNLTDMLFSSVSDMVASGSPERGNSVNDARNRTAANRSLEYQGIPALYSMPPDLQPQPESRMSQESAQSFETGRFSPNVEVSAPPWDTCHSTDSPFQSPVSTGFSMSPLSDDLKATCTLDDASTDMNNPEVSNEGGKMNVCSMNQESSEREEKPRTNEDEKTEEPKRSTLYGRESVTTTEESKPGYMVTNDEPLKSDPVPDTPKGGPVWISNLHNTCYISATIQCLFSLQEFWTELDKCTPAKPPKLVRMEGYAGLNLLESARLLQLKYEETRHDDSENNKNELHKALICFYQHLQEIKDSNGNQVFGTNTQEDAAELVTYLLDNLADHLPNREPVETNFRLNVVSYSYCTNEHCKMNQNPSIKKEFNHFLRISIPGQNVPTKKEESDDQTNRETDDRQNREEVKKSTRGGGSTTGDENVNPAEENPPPELTLQDCIDYTFSSQNEILEYKCEEVGCGNNQMKRIATYENYPKFIFMQLVRAYFDIESMAGKKDDRCIKVFDIIQLPFATSRMEIKYARCRLRAVICHHGTSLNKGHYTALVFNPPDKDWYICDCLANIASITEEDREKYLTYYSYCFFYERIDEVDEDKN